jgi:hypothetical protein
VRVIDIKQAEAYFGTTLPGELREGAKRGLLSAANRIVQEIQTRTIPEAVPQPVARGLYRAGWRAQATDDGAEYFNPLPRAGLIEYGVRASNVKVGRTMITALADWVKVKGIATGTDALRMAFAIARTMAASYRGQPGGAKGIFKGTGLGIMKRANKILPRVVEEEVRREIQSRIGW